MGRRTTTKMVNNSRRRAGLSTIKNRNSSSLVNYLQRNGNVLGARLNAMNAGNSVADKIAKNNAAKLQDSSSQLVKQTELLGEKIEKGSDQISSAAAGMVDQFNETLKNMSRVSGMLNNYYRQSMEDVAAANREGLAEIGILVASDGSLTLNKEKFESADGEKIKKMLGADGDFTKRMSYVASRVADNATASVESASSTYNSRGDIMNSYLSRFNYRG